jgi:hypothetical protein
MSLMQQLKLPEGVDLPVVRMLKDLSGLAGQGP